MGKVIMQCKEKKKKTLVNLLLEKSGEYSGLPELNLYLQRILGPNFFQALQNSKMTFLMFKVDGIRNAFCQSRFFLPLKFHSMPTPPHAFLEKFNP
jgi:hypothetical protein